MTDRGETIPPSSLVRLTHLEARAALLKSESYFDFELPKYFEFSAMLAKISDALSVSPLPHVVDTKPQDAGGVNHTILHNKDGRLAWRPQELIHPFIYVEIVHRLTEPDSWELVQQRFTEFAQDSRIECISLPVISNSEKSDKAAQILKWWEDNELGSLELSLEFEHVLMTDVTDCYGSLYTHSIAWALHEKEYAQSKEGKDKGLLGNILDSNIRSTRRNQTNGIPQGSNLSNLLAEMVLGYGDLLVSQLLNEEGLSDFKIMRYRDDYRVFSNSRHDCEVIVRKIGDVLRDFGLKLNPGKTAMTDELIHAAVKEDKRYWLKAKSQPRGLIKHLMVIHDLAYQHPNSGRVSRVLMEFQKKIVGIASTQERVGPMVAILTDIAIHNPRTFPVYASILSRMFTWVDVAEREGLLEKIRAKFKTVPHAGQLELWLQRFTEPSGLPANFDEPLCHSVTDPDHQLWNSDWLHDKHRKLLKASEYFDQGVFDGLGDVVQSDEVQLFNYGS
jgi:RNA-directed DNA polymerase